MSVEAREWFAPEGTQPDRGAVDLHAQALSARSSEGYHGHAFHRVDPRPSLKNIVAAEGVSIKQARS